MDPMEQIWEKAAKPAKDGNKYFIFKGINDLGFLYVTGFVDAQKYSLKDWTDAFKSSQQKDGSYLVSHAQWLEKRKFRYGGVIHPPFNPLTLPEKEYSEEEVIKVLSENILPQTIFDKSAIPQILQNLRSQKKLVNGKLKVDRKLKMEVAHLIDSYPSPRRILELMVDTLKRAKKPSEALAHQTERSGFAAGKTAQQIVASRLSELAKEIKKEEAPLSEAPSISLKELKKRKPPTGRV